VMRDLSYLLCRDDAAIALPSPYRLVQAVERQAAAISRSCRHPRPLSAGKTGLGATGPRRRLALHGRPGAVAAPRRFRPSCRLAAAPPPYPSGGSIGPSSPVDCKLLEGADCCAVARSHVPARPRPACLSGWSGRRVLRYEPGTPSKPPLVAGRLLAFRPGRNVPGSGAPPARSPNLLVPGPALRWLWLPARFGRGCTTSAQRPGPGAPFPARDPWTPRRWPGGDPAAQSRKPPSWLA